MRTLFDPKLIKLTLASNESGARSAFVFRKFWKDRILVDDYNHSHMDLWYDKPLYGRVNDRGTIVHLSETNLKQLRTDEETTVLAVDFVADAFDDFRYHMETSLARGLISKEANITEFVPKSGWVSFQRSHTVYMEQLYEYLSVEWLTKEGRSRKILNFSGFLNEFLGMVNAKSRILPITATTYMMSRHFSPRASGLMIEIDEQSYSNDAVKQKDFVQDPNFRFYRNAAKKYGFIVDKNAPWRLIANVESPQMKKYMKQYGLNSTKELFDTYYYETYLFDVDILANHLVGMYNAYVSAYPDVKVIKTKLKGPGGVNTVSKLVRRNRTSLEEVKREFKPGYWLKTYYYIKLREIGHPLDPLKFNKELKKILQMNNLFDFDRALSYINTDIMKKQRSNSAISNNQRY